MKRLIAALDGLDTNSGVQQVQQRKQVAKTATPEPPPFNSERDIPRRCF